MRKFILASSLLIGLSAPLAAAAPAKSAAAPASSSTSKDVQCFILFASAVGNAKDETTAKPATIGLAFYLGKITRGAPALNLLDAVKQESKVIQAGNPQVIGKACEQEFTARMAAVDAMGKALSSGK